MSKAAVIEGTNVRIFYLKSLFTKHPWTNTGLSFFFFFFLKSGEARRKERNAFRERQLGVDFLSKTTDHPESCLFSCNHQSCRLDVAEALISLMCFMKDVGEGKPPSQGNSCQTQSYHPFSFRQNSSGSHVPSFGGCTRIGLSELWLSVSLYLSLVCTMVSSQRVLNTHPPTGHWWCWEALGWW